MTVSALVELAFCPGDRAACDFFTLPTATFRVLYVFIVLRHDRRKVVHFNVTKNPSAQWIAQQIVNAFPYEEAPRFLVRDRDNIYGKTFRDTVDAMDIEEVPTAPRSPWQNPCAERVIGSIRRECLDHLIVLGEAHLKRFLISPFQYYHASRPHLSLSRNSPIPRELDPNVALNLDLSGPVELRVARYERGHRRLLLLLTNGYKN